MDPKFLLNRYLLNRRIVDGWKFQFLPYGGGPENEEYFKEFILKEGHCFIDIGTNTGGWTVQASRFYDQVYGFEANPLIQEVLENNLSLNRIHNVISYPIAVGDKEEKKDLLIYSKNGQDSFLPYHVGLHSTDRKIQVQIETLDSFLLEPDVIKIDTEGYEIPVIKGGMETIAHSKPVLCIETHDEKDSDIIQSILPDYSWIHKERINENGKQNILIGKIS